MTVSSVPTESQRASAQIHLSRREQWRYVWIKGERYIAMPSSNGRGVYVVRADGRGCSCPAYLKGCYSICSHMLAAKEAANRDALAEWLSTGEQPSISDESKPVARPKPVSETKVRPTYRDIFGVCDQTTCDGDRVKDERYCSRHVLVDAF